MTLIKQYWNVSLLRQSPADTPYSPMLATFVGVIYLGLIILQWMLTDVSDQLTVIAALAVAGSLMLSYLLYTWIILRLYNLQARLVQTIGCLWAGHAAIHLVAFPLLLVMPLVLKEQTSPAMTSMFGMIFLVFTLVLAIWQFMVSSWIYRLALNVNWFASTLAALGLLASNVLTVSLW